MPRGANTASDIGIRRVVVVGGTAQFRNFEVNGKQQYAPTYANYSHSDGTKYAKGATLPYDGSGNTKYTRPSKMERDFNTGGIVPID